jgi:hypothetical protein
MVTNRCIVLVMSIVTSVAALGGGVATASSPDDDYDHGGDDGNPAFNMLGFRMNIGALPVDGARATTFGLGVGVEHPSFGKTRVFGEAEWLWLMHHGEREMDSVAVRPERHGNGHRAIAGLRRELVAKNAARSVRLFIDAELGGGLALTNDNAVGFTAVPTGLAGLRFGYDLYSRADASPSQTFEAELLVRAVAVPDGIGFMAGVGMAWGN